MSCCRDDPIIVSNTNINLHVTGWIIDPRVTLVYKPAPTTNKTVQFALLDINGSQVSDTYTTTLEQNRESKTWNLGDFINAQRTAKNLPPGIYFLGIKVVEDDYFTVIPLFLVQVATTIPYDEDNQYLNHIAIIDKYTGFLMRLPPTVDVIPLDDRYMVFMYYHKGKKGRLVKLNIFGQKEWDTGYHTFVELEIKLKFNTVRDMIYYMLQKAYSIPPITLKQLVDMIESGNLHDAVKLIKPLYRGLATGLGRTTIDIDYNEKAIIEKVFVYLGFIDWSKVFSYGVIGCALAVGTAVGITIATGGLGAVSFGLVGKACLIGGIAGTAVAVVTSGDSKGDPKVIDEAEKRAREAKDQITKELQEAKSLLDKLLAEGRITQQEYEQLLKHINNIAETSFRVIDELVEDVKKSYEEGYNKGYNKGLSDSKTWIIGAGLGGLAFGILIGKR